MSRRPSPKDGYAPVAGLVAALPPKQQAMKASAPEPPSAELLAEVRATLKQLEEKEATLTAASDKLGREEEALAAATGEQGKNEAGAACPRWQHVAAQRSELLVRWQCLLEERRQLRAMLGSAKDGGSGYGDFEPGETPLGDVTCSVVTHQLDTPCFSCCFQR